MPTLSRRTLLGLAALSPMALTVRTSASDQDPVPPPNACASPRLMATAGVAAGQMLRVSLFHKPTQDAIPCDESIEVLGLDGQTLGFHKGVVFPGMGEFADFDVASGLPRGERVQCHVNVAFPTGHPVGATVEVFDIKTGVTGLVDMPCDQEPAIVSGAMGTVGIVRGQVARVSLFHHEHVDALPCNEIVEIIGLDGKSLGMQQGRLDPGRGVAFDADLARADGLRRRNRLQFHVHVQVEHPDQVGARLEVFDDKTGETRFAIDPGVNVLVKG